MRRRDEDTDTLGERKPLRTQREHSGHVRAEKPTVLAPWSQTSNLQKQGGNKCPVVKPPSLWYFAMEAPANSHGGKDLQEGGRVSRLHPTEPSLCLPGTPTPPPWVPVRGSGLCCPLLSEGTWASAAQDPGAGTDGSSCPFQGWPLSSLMPSHPFARLTISRRLRA